MDKNYGGVIWTDHALQRLRDRGIKQGDAWAVWKRPDNSKFEKNKGIWIYQRTFKEERVEVVAKKNEKDRWIILSVWSRHIKGSFIKKPPRWRVILQRLVGGKNV